MTRLEALMLVLQVGCMVQSAIERKWWKCLYWAGALALTVAVVKGIKS